MQKCKEKNWPFDNLVTIFDVSIVALNLFLIPRFAFSTEVSRLPSPLLPLSKREPLQILPVVVICKLSMFELGEVLLRINHHETFVLVHHVT